MNISALVSPASQHETYAFFQSDEHSVDGSMKVVDGINDREITQHIGAFCLHISIFMPC